jgi:hypothetical protein
LPEFFERKIWRRSREGLLITAGLTIIFANLLNLEGIAVVGSASILLIYVAVNAAHLRLLRETKANPLMLWLAILVSLAFVFLLVDYEAQSSPNVVATLAGVVIFSFVAEWAIEGDRKESCGRGLRVPSYKRQNIAAIHDTTTYVNRSEQGHQSPLYRRT